MAVAVVWYSLSVCGGSTVVDDNERSSSVADTSRGR